MPVPENRRTCVTASLGLSWLRQVCQHRERKTPWLFFSEPVEWESFNSSGELYLSGVASSRAWNWSRILAVKTGKKSFVKQIVCNALMQLSYQKIQASDMLYATISAALVSVGCHHNATSRCRVGKTPHYVT